MKGGCQGVGRGVLELKDSNLCFRGESVRAVLHRCLRAALQIRKSELGQIGEGEKSADKQTDSSSGGMNCR